MRLNSGWKEKTETPIQSMGWKRSAEQVPLGQGLYLIKFCILSARSVVGIQ